MPIGNSLMQNQTFMPLSIRTYVFLFLLYICGFPSLLFRSFGIAFLLSRQAPLKVQFSLTQMSSLVWWQRRQSYLLIHLVPLCNFRVVSKQCAHFGICLNLKLRSPGKSSRLVPCIDRTWLISYMAGACVSFEWSSFSGWSWINIPCTWLQIKENYCYLQENTCKISYDSGSDLV